MEYIVGALCAVFAAPPFCFKWVTPEGMRKYAESIVFRPGFVGYLYVENGETAGFCLGCVFDYHDTPPVFEISEIVVEPPYQRGGMGTRMLAEVETALAAKGVKAVILHTGRNLPAFQWYLKNGYAVDDTNVSLSKTLL